MQGAASGAINNITQLGIGLNNDGTLTLEYGHAEFSVLNSQLLRCDRVSAELRAASARSLATSLNNLGTQAPNGAVSSCAAAE